MRRIKRFFQRVLFSEDLTVNERITNMVLMAICGSMICAMILRIALQGRVEVIVTMGAAAVISGALFCISDRFRVHDLAGTLAVVIICDTLFPVLYYQLGGVNSSIAAFFVLGMVFVFLVGHKRRFFVLLYTNIFIGICCFLVDFFFPGLMRVSVTPLDQFKGSVQTFGVVSLCVTVFIVFQHQIYNDEKKKTDEEEQKILRQDRLLRVINEVSQILLTADTKDFEESIKKSMALLGECAKVDRINMWKNFWKDGALHYRTVYLWTPDETRKMEPVSYPYDIVMPEWKATLSAGQVIAGPVKNLSPIFQRVLSQSEIVSVLVLPVFLQDEFWGFVSFDDCVHERDFPEDEQGILKTAAILLANGVMQGEMDEEISKADERVRLMLESSPLVCNFWDDQLNCIAGNEKTRELFGLKDKSEYLDKFLDISPTYQPGGESSRKLSGELIERAFNSDRFAFEWMHKTPDGAPLPVEVNVVRLKRGDTYNFLGYTRDLRESKRMMSAIKKKGDILNAVNESSALLLNSRIDTFAADLKESMKILAEALDTDRMYVWKNLFRDNEWYAVKSSVWIGDETPAEDFPPEVSYIRDLPGWYERLSGEKSINGPVKNFAPRLQDFFLLREVTSVLVAPVFLDGDFWGIVSFADCLAERYFSDEEEAILRSASLLIANAMVQNEMNQNLVETRKEALASAKAKSAFLAMMSHEIRTPLNAIIGLTEIQLQNNLPPDTNEDLEKIHSSGSKLLVIINDLLDISKMEADSFDLVSVEYSLAAFIEAVIQEAAAGIESKPVEFTLEIDPALPSALLGDERRVKQIVENVLSNAFKFTQKGTVKMAAGLEETGAPEGSVVLVFTVYDTGIGIKREDLDILFAEYSQIDMKANRRITGTGLGLSVAKRLAVMMGGDITAESEYGAGSVFTVRLVQKVVDPAPIDPDVLEELKGKRYVRLETPQAKLVRSYMPYARALVVDDVPTNLDVALGLLSPYGIKTDCAQSGADAIRLVQSRPPYDIIFMDHLMPGLSGIEAAKQIRELEETMSFWESAVFSGKRDEDEDEDEEENEETGERKGGVPIVALTANALVENDDLFLKNGFDAVLAKPINMYRLDEILNRFVRDKQSEETLREAEEAAKAAEPLAASPGEPEDMPLAIDGVDTSRALDQYSSEEIYEGILKSYAAHTPELLAKLKALTPETLKDYAITVHGLKSASYGIFAQDIGKRAEELEALSKAGDYAEVVARNPDFVKSAETLVAAIRAALEKGAGEGGKEARDAISPEALASVLEAARRFQTMELEKIVAEINRYAYRNDSDAELAAWLAEQTDNLEYDAICEKLEALV